MRRIRQLSVTAVGKLLLPEHLRRPKGFSELRAMCGLGVGAGRPAEALFIKWAGGDWNAAICCPEIPKPRVVTRSLPRRISPARSSRSASITQERVVARDPQLLHPVGESCPPTTIFRMRCSLVCDARQQQVNRSVTRRDWDSLRGNPHDLGRVTH
jgi:hypothetical protein